MQWSKNWEAVKLRPSALKLNLPAVRPAFLRHPAAFARFRFHSPSSAPEEVGSVTTKDASSWLTSPASKTGSDAASVSSSNSSLASASVNYFPFFLSGSSASAAVALTPFQVPVMAPAS